MKLLSKDFMDEFSKNLESQQRDIKVADCPYMINKMS